MRVPLADNSFLPSLLTPAPTKLILKHHYLSWVTANDFPFLEFSCIGNCFGLQKPVLVSAKDGPFYL